MAGQIPQESNSGAKRPAIAAVCSLLLLVFIYNVGFDKFLRSLLQGLPYGGIIALIAMGYSMVYGIILLINFAHGEIFMIGSYLMLELISQSEDRGATYKAVGLVAIFTLTAGWVLFERTRIPWKRMLFSLLFGTAVTAGVYYLFLIQTPFFLAIVVSVALTGMLGVSVDQLAYKPLRNSPRLVPLITAIGISLVLSNTAQVIWTARSRVFPEKCVPAIFQTPFLLPSGELITDKLLAGMSLWGQLSVAHKIRLMPGVYIPLIDLFIIVSAILCMVCVHLLIHKTRIGQAMRATAQDKTTAGLMGVRANRVVAFTFLLGSGLAALCAPLYVAKYYAPIEPTMGYVVGILAFASAVLGGIGNIRGAMLGGFAIGIIYNFVPIFNDMSDWKFIQMLSHMKAFSGVEDWNFLSGISNWRLGVAYAFMILVIILKPTGLLGKASAQRA